VTDEELIAAHLAKKGATKIAVGTSNNIPSGHWYKAAQGEIDLNEKLADGPLPVKEKKKAKPARKDERFYHADWRRSN
jgi:hypothetical protein